MIPKPTTPKQALDNAIHAAEEAHNAPTAIAAESWASTGMLWLRIAEEMRAQKNGSTTA